MNRVTVLFVECTPAPANGYNVQWRVFGTFGAYTDAGNFLTSPAIFDDITNPDGTDYEGIIRSDCSESGSGESGANFGESVAWTTGAIPCKQITMSATVGTPSAHYIDCDGIEHDTVITTNTVICTNGAGMTISGGGIVINSEVEGPC
jgi:hypothetical protein